MMRSVPRSPSALFLRPGVFEEINHLWVLRNQDVRDAGTDVRCGDKTDASRQAIAARGLGLHQIAPNRGGKIRRMAGIQNDKETFILPCCIPRPLFDVVSSQEPRLRAQLGLSPVILVCQNDRGDRRILEEVRQLVRNRVAQRTVGRDLTRLVVLRNLERRQVKMSR
jgi:hypothetical protein